MNNTIYKIQVVSQKIFSKSNQNNLYTCHSLQRLFSKSKKVQIKKCEEKGEKGSTSLFVTLQKSSIRLSMYLVEVLVQMSCVANLSPKSE